MEQTWRDVVGYEGIYEVSDAGVVRQVRPLKTVPYRGHPRVALFADGKVSHVFVHTLVAKAFHGPARRGGVVEHLDGDPGNVAASNLRWATQADLRAARQSEPRGPRQPAAMPAPLKVPARSIRDSPAAIRAESVSRQSIENEAWERALAAADRVTPGTG